MIIIDAGHGGADGGAVAPDGSAESEINLEIALKTECIADFLGIENIMTRREEALPYPEDAVSIAEKKRWDQMRRLELINSQSNSILISIHQNIYPDPRPRGPQVLYSAAAGSAELGEICHGLLNANLCPENRRVAAPISDRIFLMKNAKCPAILIECGFLSNSDELQLLKDGDYQKKISAIIMASYIIYSG